MISATKLLNDVHYKESIVVGVSMIVYDSDKWMKTHGCSSAPLDEILYSYNK